MGAELAIDSKVGQGTQVTISIPNIDLKKQRPKPKNSRTSAVEA